MSSRPRTSAPTPLSPPILWAESVKRSAPSAPISQAMRPAACTASTCRRPPAACTIAAASATGCSAPVSLLASMIETKGREALATASASAASLTRPSASTGMSSIASRGKRPPARTEACSIAEINKRSRGRFSSIVSIGGDSASILASVPLEVKITSAGRAATSCATSSRARSIMCRAARPSACTEEGLPVSAKASRKARSASGRNGAVAFQSR